MNLQLKSNRMKALYSAFLLLFFASNVGLSQTLIDTYSDGNFSATPAWSGDANWTISANSDVAAGATGSNTLRLNVASGAGTQNLRTQIATWGTTQEWTFFVGRRAQAYTLANNLEIWLYGNEADLENATVDGYALLIGDDTGNDEIRLARMTNGASASTIITSSTAIPNGQTDFGFLVRVTRNSSGVWNLFTSVVPTANGTGAIASNTPNGNTAFINQGSATDNTHAISANGYFGLVAVHSSGAVGRAAVEFDQFYFTPNPSSIAIASGTISAGNVTQGTTNNVLYRIDLTPSTANATLGSVYVTTAGTYQTSDIQTNGMKLRYSTDATLDGADPTLASIAAVASGSQLAFTGLTQVLTSGSTYYLFVTADISASAVAARTINITSTAFASSTNRITFNSGLTTGTSPLAAGGLKTIVAGLAAPTPQTLPFSQNFGTTSFSANPTGFVGWSGLDGGAFATQAASEASSPTTNASIIAEPAAFPGEPSGGLFGQLISGNANLVIATSNNATDGLNQPVTAINTGTSTTVNITYDQIVRFSGSRTMGIALQYRAGTSGSWTTVSSSPTSYGASPTLNSVTNKTLSVTGLTASTDYQFRWITWRNHASGSTNTSIGLDNISFSGLPLIALSSPLQTGASNINPSTSNNILSNFQAAVTVSNATLNSLAFTTTGTYNATDLTGNFSLFYHTTSTFASASSIGTVAVGAAGTYTFTGLTQSITSGTTGYFWIVANSSATAGGSRTLTVSANPTLTFASGTPTGTITAGGTKTFTSLVPSIAISNNSPTASNHNAGSTNVVLQRIDLAVTVTDASLTGLTVTTAGTYAAADLTNLKVRYSADATLDGGDATLSTKSTVLGAGSHVFPSFTSQTITSGSTGYVFITADIASSATGGNAINLASTAFSNITFSTGTKTGTDPVVAGNSRTIVNPAIAISGTSPAASSHLQGSTAVVLHRFDFAVTSSNATLTGITVTTAGSYISADVTNLKVRYSTDATLDGGDATLSTFTTPGTAGSKTFPSFTSQVINSGSTGYIFITADISATATSGNTISLGSTVFSNLTFSLGNKSGTDPIAAGNARTFIKAEPSNYPTLFACGTTTTATIPLSFTAATGSVLPDGYLIKWSSTSYAAISDPADGTAEANGASVQNVTVSPYTVTGLASGTTFYFKIWSYTNSGTNINYKLVGEPQTSCTTLTGPFEDFETGSKGGYAAADVTLTSGSWNLSDALLGGLANDKKNGLQSMRMQNTGIARMNFNRTSGIGTVDILHAVYGTDANSTWQLEASTDNGTTWTAYVSSVITTSSSTLVNQSFTVNLSGNVRLRIVKLSGGGARISFDDIYLTNYAACTPPTTTTVVTPSNATTDGADVSWTGASGDGTMLVIRATANTIANPTSGTSYTANTAWASAGQINTNNRVVFRASGSSVTGLTGLTAETQYTATAYNYNNTGNCYQLTSPASNTFYTLSSEPAAHAASFTSTPDSPSQITLTFSAASTITNADGYLIFRRASAAPTFTPTDATAYTVGNTYGDAVLVANISSTATTSFVNNTGLSSSTAYHYILVPYNWNGSIAATYNYRTAATIPATNATTPAPTPEINIQGNSTNISDGDVSPSTADHTDFGGVLVSSGTIVRTFTIQNTGSANLNLTGAPLVAISGANAADFSVTTVPTSPVAAAGSITFQVTFNPSAAGTRTASISIDNNDSDENPYNFNIQGTGLVPEIQLEQPVATNQACGFNYDYGSHLLSTNTDITVRIRNTGDGALETVSVALSGLDASEFSFFSSPSATIAATSFSNFVIRFTPTSGGSKVAVVTISSSDADEGTCTINLYGEGDASPVIPTLTIPTVSAILNTSATLGATITNDGNAAISARGTVWKTTSPVVAADNALAEGGTSVSSFSHSRTSLPVGTRIYYRGYATNSAGTGLSPESNFFTLSNEPVGNAATFSATTFSATQINLSFSAASTISASGYIILMKAGSAVTGTPNDATNYNLNDVVGDANVVGLITTGSTFAVTGLSANTIYHFALVPYSWNGSDNQTKNYYVSPLRVANATTNAASNPVLGDIAFVSYATDAPDRFAFVALADIAANAQIAFTDNAWSSGAAICTNEETVRWQAPSTGVTKGTVIRIQGTSANVGSIVSGNLNNLSASGDQILAYTGTAASPSFIAGLSTTTLLGSCQTCGTSTNASCLPSPLVNGVNTISFASHADNGYYVGAIYGTAATLRTEINNPANWIRSNTNQTWPLPWSFTIGNVTITTGTISPTTYCVTNSTGTSISIPYTTGGTFETGNVFTAQLSDASGSFAIPTNIGFGIVSPIVATIPAGTANGSGYRVRVISSDPEANGLQNATNLTVFLNTPDASTLSALRQNGGAIVNWTNPSGTVCWDQILVVAQPTNAFTALPTGDGTAYTANITFGSGTAFGTGGSVVFKGTGAAVTINGLTNATTYFIKVFVRRGTQWSEGIEVSVVPSPDITGDFRSRVTTGNWSVNGTWERYNGTSWVNATSGQFPDNTTTTVTIQSGHTITVDGSSDPYDVGTVIVSAGGKLYTNLTSTNRYLTVFGDIICNGIIGNGSTFDGMSFNFQGTKSTISGTGTFDCSRLRRNDAGGTVGGTTDLIIAMNVNLRWNQSSGTAIYNNDNRGTGCRFNLTVNENSTLSCIPTTGSASGNASIDGVDGSTGATDRRGGTYTINGTMNIPGTLYAKTDNDATGGYFCKWVIGTTGVINCRQIDFAASGAAGHTFEIKQGGKLNINNNNDNSVNSIINFSTTNNTFTFENGSIIEYSSSDLIGTQKIFINAGFPYKNLLLSNLSTKQLSTSGTLNVGGDLTITGGILDIQTNNIDLKGNWENYSQAGFTEGIQKVTFSGTAKQTIQCIGGEQFYDVDITNSTIAGVELNTDLIISNDLELFTNGKLVFGATPQKLRLSKMTASSNTFKGSGSATVDMSAAEHEFTIGCPDASFSGVLNAGATSTIIYNRDEDFAGSTDDQNLLTGFNYANLLLTGKGNKVISNNLTVNGNFTAETPDLVISSPNAGRIFTLAGNFLLNSGATMNDNCRDNQDLVTSGNGAQVFNTNTKNLKAFNLKSTKTSGGISLTGGAVDQTTLNLKNDFALDYTGTAVFTDNANTINVGDDAELGSGSSTASNFAFSGLMQFNGIGAATDIHLSDYAGTAVTRAELNNVIVRAGENATIDRLEVYPTAGGQSVTVKGNLEIIQGANSSELDANNNTINIGGNWTNYNSSAFIEGTNSTVEFNGTALQTINTASTGEIFHRLRINNTTGVQLSSSAQASHELLMIDGNITTGSNLMILGNSTTQTGTLNYTSGVIFGNFRRWFAAATNSGASTGLFPMGSGINQKFVTVEYTTAPTSGGNLTATYNTGNMAAFGVPTTNYVIPAEGSCGSPFLVSTLSDDGYWEMADNGTLTTGNYDITFDAEGFTTINNLCQLTALKRVGAGNWLQSGNHKAATGTLLRPIVKREGATGWSNWGFGGGPNNPLPIELLSFNAVLNKSNTVDLSWSTASEINNDFFTIEKSKDAIHFEEVLQQKGAGNSNSVLNYNDVDKNPFSGVSYYRLKQTDFNGDYTYSDIVPVSLNNKDVLNVNWVNYNAETGVISGIVNSTNKKIEFKLYDLSGRLIMSNTQVVEGNSFSFHLDTNIPKSMYLLHVNNGLEMKIVKVN